MPLGTEAVMFTMQALPVTAGVWQCHAGEETDTASGPRGGQHMGAPAGLGRWLQRNRTHLQASHCTHTHLLLWKPPMRP